MQTLSVICLYLPLAGVAALALLNTRISRPAAAWLGTAVAFGSFLAAVAVFFQILGEGQSQREHVFHLYTWAASPSFTVPFTLPDRPALGDRDADRRRASGSLIVMYSIGYMHGDPKERRFFAYLDLFLFSMLLLVMAGDFVLLLAGWGLVGLSSYLLIGFWHERPEPVEAAKKAFVMNAVGDIGIVIAIFFMVRDIGTTQYGQVFSQAPHIWAKGSADANWVALLLLIGAVAKSAQIPLHTWLPDAMEGPTPVSALIHAATMVTAGVYLVARAHPLFENAPDVHGDGRAARRGHAADGGRDRDRADRHQAHHRLLDHEPDRLHVHRGRDRGVLGGHVPPAHARLLQGPALPRRRHRHPRPGRRAGRAQDGRPGRGPAPHQGADVDRHRSP